MSTCLVLFLGLAFWIYSCGLALPEKTIAPKTAEHDERWEEDLCQQWSNEEYSDDLEFDFIETVETDSREEQTFNFDNVGNDF